VTRTVHGLDPKRKRLVSKSALVLIESLSSAWDRPATSPAMTAITVPAPSSPAADAPTVVMRPGALLHRVREAASAVWRLAPGRYLAIPDGDEVVVLRLGVLTRIGRRATADIVIDDMAVSRRHALVFDRDGTPVIADDRSRNGVYVNGRRVREAPLQHGDQVQIGSRVMRYLEA
jgi:FHA domain